MPSTSTSAKPTAKAPAKPSTIGVKQLAEHLEVEPRVLRAFLRRSKRAVGRGTRYEWTPTRRRRRSSPSGRRRRRRSRRRAE